MAIVSTIDPRVQTLFHCVDKRKSWGCSPWLNAETVERAPTLLFGRLVRCSAHGRSFREATVLVSLPPGRTEIECYFITIESATDRVDRKLTVVWCATRCKLKLLKVYLKSQIPLIVDLSSNV